MLDGTNSLVYPVHIYTCSIVQIVKVSTTLSSYLTCCVFHKYSSPSAVLNGSSWVKKVMK